MLTRRKTCQKNFPCRRVWVVLMPARLNMSLISCMCMCIGENWLSFFRAFFCLFDQSIRDEFSLHVNSSLRLSAHYLFYFSRSISCVSPSKFYSSIAFSPCLCVCTYTIVCTHARTPKSYSTVLHQIPFHFYHSGSETSSKSFVLLTSILTSLWSFRLPPTRK